MLLHPPHQGEQRLGGYREGIILKNPSFFCSIRTNKWSSYLRTRYTCITRVDGVFSLLTLWMIHECSDPKVGNFGNEFWPLLKIWLAKLVVFLLDFEDFLTGLFIQSVVDKYKQFISVQGFHMNKHFVIVIGHKWTDLSISFCTSSICSIASCCSFSEDTKRAMIRTKV